MAASLAVGWEIELGALVADSAAAGGSDRTARRPLAADRAGLLDHEDDEAGGRQGEDERGKAVGSCVGQLRREQGRRSSSMSK